MNSNAVDVDITDTDSAEKSNAPNMDGPDIVMENGDRPIIRLSREIQTDVYCSPEEIELTRSLSFRRREINIYQVEVSRLYGEMQETMIREERAQSMMMGAEKRLRNTEGELDRMKEMRDVTRRAHIAEVSRLERELEFERERGWMLNEERWKLRGKVEEIIRQLEESHKCSM